MSDTKTAAPISSTTLNYTDSLERMMVALSAKTTNGSPLVHDSSDPVVALIDAWALVTDVFGFYQQRQKQESYLRSADEQFSMRAFSRMVGYELSPGVAADTVLAFTVDENASGGIAQVPKGTQVQSVPTDSELPQIFETDEDLTARAAWNLIKPYVPLKQRLFGLSAQQIILSGTNTGLQVGDRILLSGLLEGKLRFDIMTIISLFINNEQGYTEIYWEYNRSFTSGQSQTSQEESIPAILDRLDKHGGITDNILTSLILYPLRKRTGCFGNNAPRKSSLGPNSGYAKDWDSETPIPTIWTDSQGNLNAPAQGNSNAPDIYLEQAFPDILVGAWVVCIAPGVMQIYQVNGTSEVTKVDYGLSNRVTGLKLIGINGQSPDKNTPTFTFRDTVIFIQSDLLSLYIEFVPAETVIKSKENGITLDGVVNGLTPGQKLVIASTPVEQSEQITVNEYSYDENTKVTTLKLTKPLLYEYQTGTYTISALGILDETTVAFDNPDNQQQLSFVTSSKPDFFSLGLTGELKFKFKGISAVFSEVITLIGSKIIDNCTYLSISQTLEHSYNPVNAVIYGNVVSASHGETIIEVLGSGDGTQDNQSFNLNKSPLTYLPASTITGTQAALEVRVNGVLWKETENMLDLTPNDRAYILQHEDNGQVNVIFGDGIHGARLPTGQENVEAIYRVGTGLAGQLPKDSLTLLQTQPLGIKAVTNPLPATGATDAATLNSARIDIPLSTKALNRIVSLNDFNYFVRAFADINKSQVSILKPGPGGQLYITIAGTDGAVINKSSALYQDLLTAIEKIRVPGQIVDVGNYEPIKFNVTAVLTINPDYLPDDVMIRARQSLLNSFSFQARNLGQNVAASEVIKVLQNVEGVFAVNTKALYYEQSVALLNNMLLAQPARFSNNQTEIKPAQLLTVNPLGIKLSAIVANAI